MLIHPIPQASLLLMESLLYSPAAIVQAPGRTPCANPDPVAGPCRCGFATDPPPGDGPAPPPPFSSSPPASCRRDQTPTSTGPAAYSPAGNAAAATPVPPAPNARADCRACRSKDSCENLPRKLLRDITRCSWPPADGWQSDSSLRSPGPAARCSAGRCP